MVLYSRLLQNRELLLIIVRVRRLTFARSKRRICQGEGDYAGKGCNEEGEELSLDEYVSFEQQY